LYFHSYGIRAGYLASENLESFGNGQDLYKKKRIATGFCRTYYFDLIAWRVED
jgi:hypothetical protein